MKQPDAGILRGDETPILIAAGVLSFGLGFGLLSPESPMVVAAAVGAALATILALVLGGSSEIGPSPLWWIGFVPLVRAAMQSAFWPLPGLVVGVPILAWKVMTTAKTTRFSVGNPKPVWQLVGIGLLIGAPLALVALTMAAVAGTVLVTPIRWPSPIPLAIGLPAVALLNASVEEFIWRYALLDRLLATGLTFMPCILLQALSFGIPHWSGLPSGWIGVGGALTLGVILGGLTIRTRSILPAIVAHTLVDLSLFWYVVNHGLLGGVRAG